jgi:hypothetical protein
MNTVSPAITEALTSKLSRGPMHSPARATLSAVLLLAWAGQSLQAQTFKAGDYVDVQAYGQWLPGRVKSPIYYGPAGQCGAPAPNCSRIGAYIVSYVTIPTNGPEDNTVALADIRARVATGDDKRVATETATALSRQPRGNSIGAKYGTREPRPCGSRTAPAHGSPSAEQATQYVICELERGDGVRPLSLVTNVKVQVASVSHPPNELVKAITAADIDPREPIWDIRGSFTSYRCYSLGSLIASNDFARTHNCWISEQPSAKGYCYKDTFGDWHCGMLGTVPNWRTNVLPPEGY